MKAMHREYVVLLCVLALVPRVAAGQIAVLTDGVMERDVRTGDTYHGTIRLRNTTGERQQVKVYKTDYQFTADGQTEYGQPGLIARSNASWISLSRLELVLQAGEEGVVAYTVNVPDNQHLVGTFWSMVMVEGLTGERAGGDQAPRTVDLEMRTRHGIQIVTHLAGGSMEARFEGLRVLERTEGGWALEFEVVNAGERAWRVSLAMEVYDDRGELVARRTSARGLLYSGSSLRQRFDLESLGAGDYRALLLADTGAEEIFGAQYRLGL